MITKVTYPISTAANSSISQSEATKNLNELSRCDSIFSLKPPNFTSSESIWLKLPKKSKKISKKKFHVFQEDSIFITRRRSHKKLLRMGKDLELDFDNESTDEMLEDSIYFQMKLTLKNVLRIKETRGGKIRRRKKYLQRMVMKFNVDGSDEENSDLET